MILLRSLIFTVIVPGSVTILVPALLRNSSLEFFRPDQGAWGLVGLPLIVVGVAMYVWCVADFALAGRGTPLPADPPKALVMRGLYRYTRNPMYVAVVSMLLGEAVIFGSGLLLAYVAAVAAAVHLLVVLYEEPTLRRKFGAAYEDYCRGVPRWLVRWH